MNPQEKREFDQMKQQLDGLLKWKAEKERQQISYPLDTQSQTVLQKYFMSISRIFDFTLFGVADNPARRFVGVQGNYAFEVAPQSLFTYTVNVTTNVITVEGTNMVNDQPVLFTTDNTLPNPLSGITTYYVINSTGTTFKISATVGGAEINITNVGVGRQYIYREI